MEGNNKMHMIKKPSERKEYMVSALIALVPIAIIMGILKEITGIGGVLPHVIAFLGGIELVKATRRRRREKKEGQQNIPSKLTFNWRLYLAPLSIVGMGVLIALIIIFDFFNSSFMESFLEGITSIWDTIDDFSIFAAFIGAFSSFGFMLLFQYLEERRQKDRELETVLLDLNDWIFILQSDVVTQKTSIEELLRRDGGTPLLIKSLPIRSDFFTKLPFDKLNPLPKELTLFQTNTTMLNNHIDFLNQICMLFNQFTLVKAGGGDQGNVGLGICKSWRTSASDLTGAQDEFLEKLREIICEITAYQDYYGYSKKYTKSYVKRAEIIARLKAKY